MEKVTKTPNVKAQMLIRRPVAVVFDAFIDPDITKNFWFTKGSAKLEAGKTVTWEWEIYNFTSSVLVKEIVKNKKISVEWEATTVDFEFESLSEGTTYVNITQYGFKTTGAKLLAEINDSSGGFTTVVDGLKAYLEYGINLNLIQDKFPKGVEQHDN